VNILITIPHYSTLIPVEFRKEFLLEEKHMNRHLDFGTEKVFDLPGFEVLKATSSRFVVDINRERNDLSEGQGVVITHTWDGEPVLKKLLLPEEIEKRLSAHYDPFYKKLDEFLEKTKKPLFVLDGHSMDSKGSLVSGDPGKERPQICLATGRGTCSEKIVSLFEKELACAGYHVERNNPYSGARAKIIHYAHSREGVQALELEVNKSLYMDEKTFGLKEEEIKKLRTTLVKVLKKLQKNLV